MKNRSNYFSNNFQIAPFMCQHNGVAHGQSPDSFLLLYVFLVWISIYSYTFVDFK